MNKIYVLGSMNMDLVIHTPYMPKNGETLTGSGFFINEGGKGANQAVAACKQEVSTYLIGCVGNDIFGKKMIRALKKYHVHCEYVQTLQKQNSGIAMIIIENHDNRIILESGANHQIHQELIDQALASADEKDVFITQLENNVDAIEYGLKKAKEKKMITIFNPAPAKELNEQIYQDVDYLILNETECEILTKINPKTKKNKQDAFEYLKQRGLNCLIITLGKKGAVYIDENQYIQVQANKVEAIDTTAAGDTFVGVFATLVRSTKDIESSLKYACICSSLTCLKQGAQQAIPTKKEINHYLKTKKIYF